VEEEKVEAWMVIEDAKEDTEVEVAAAAGTPLAQPERVHGTAIKLYDSGASQHMSPSRKRFITYQRIEPIPIKAANKGVFYAIGTGDLWVEVPDGKSSTSITLKDVLYAPNLSNTVISVNRISLAGYSVTFEDSKCIIKDKRRNMVIGVIPMSPNGLYKVEHAYAAIIAPERISLAMLHHRLVHIGPHAIHALVCRGAVEGVELTDDNTLFACDSCEQAKSTHKPIRKEREEPLASSFGEEVHSDVWGPSPMLSVGKSKYYITFTDDFSCYTRLTTMCTKDGALQAYKDYAAWAYTQHGARVKHLHSDHGGEYTGGEFTSFLKEQGTERRLTTHDTPQHNGVAESLNRRLIERVRALLHQSSLPKTLWAEALHFIVWVKNRTLTKALGNVTPFERLTGRKPNLAGVPEWGQQVWVHTAGNPKLDPQAAMVHWVRYDENSTHAHRIYWPGQQKVSVERDVRFTDISTTISIPASVLAPTVSAPTTPMPGTGSMTSTSPPLSTGSTPSTPAQVVSMPQLPPAATDSGEEEIEVEDELTDAPPPTTRKKKSKSKAAAQPIRQSARLHAKKVASGEGAVDGVTQSIPGWHLDRAYDSSLLTELFADLSLDAEEAHIVELEEAAGPAVQQVGRDPKTLHEARSCSDWPKWKEAMDREIDTLRKAGTWRTVPHLANKNVVDSKWVYRTKYKADGTVEKYKAHVVVRGFTQVYGVDYMETYAPVAKLASLRTILALAARLGWRIDCFDFNAAYLNGELGDSEEIYMELPPGYGGGNTEYVAKLDKALYGLKQAGRIWYDTFARALAELGFHASAADPSMFYVRFGEHTLILIVHVDDCTLTGSCPKLMVKYKEKLDSIFPLTDLGNIHFLLGIQVVYDQHRHTISLSQSSFIDTIITCFSLTDAKPYNTPMVPSATYSKRDSPSSPTDLARMRKVPYREAIGSLMYVAVTTCPDISFAVSTLSQFLDNPGEAHWEAVKHIFHYLKGTRDHTLTYGMERQELHGYTDADRALQEHRHAISGHAFIIDGGAVSWSSWKQELVTLSTAEVEYVAATHATKECIWLRRLTGELFPSFNTTTTLFCDNQATLKLTQNDNYHARTKHIDIRVHFICKVIVGGAINMVYCPTEDMTADILTKALPHWKVRCHSLGLGLRQPSGGVQESEGDEEQTRAHGPRGALKAHLS
jgi:hypothetical protein